MPKPRQFVQMIPGDVLALGASAERWEVTATSGPSGFAYFCYDQLDLRALMAGKESGVQLTSLILQEAGPWGAAISGDRGYFMVIDMVTTQRPTETFISEIWEQPNLPGKFPGFLLPENIAFNEKTADEQDFNPSQVTWGLWRLMAPTSLFLLGTNLAIEVSQSGYFGTGEPIVSPGMWWTRIVVPYQDSDAICIPCANLVSQGIALDLSTPQEISQMMRAVQR